MCAGTTENRFSTV